MAVGGLLSATSKGNGAGVTGWTYEHILVVVQVSSEGRRADLQFINLILAGELPRSCFLLKSSWRDSRSCGMGHQLAVWYRIVMICALVQKGCEVACTWGTCR